MPDDNPVFCSEPQCDEETIEVTASARLPAVTNLCPPVMTDFDWLEHTESNGLLHPFEVRAAR